MAAVASVQAVPRTPEQPGRRRRWSGPVPGRGLIVALLVATALFRMTQNMATTTVSLLAGEAVHLGATAVGVLGAVLGLMVALVTLLLSRRVPHHRAATSAVWGMTGLAGSLLVLAAAPSFGVLAGGVVLLGAAGGVAMPGLLNAIVSSAGRDRERIIAVYTVTLSVSLAIGPLLETVVLSAAHQNVRVPYVVFAGFPVVGAALLVAARRGRGAATSPTEGGGAAWGGPEPDRPSDPEQPSAGDDGDRDAATALVADAAGDVADEPAGRAGPRDRRRRGWRAGLLATPDGRTALVSQLLYAVPFSGVTVFGALVARRGFGATPAQAQLGFTVFFVCSLAARAAVAWRAPIVAKRALLWVSAGLTAAGLVLLGTGHGLIVLMVATGVLGVPHGLTFPLALALVADATPVADLPRANATLLGSTNLVSVIVPVVLGAVVPAMGYRGMMLAILVPVAAFSVVQLAVGSNAAAARPGGPVPPGRPHGRPAG